MSNRTEDNQEPNLPAAINELRDLIRDRKITKGFFDSDKFSSLWSEVLKYLDDRDPAVVWTALSTLGRMSAISVPAKRLAQPLISKRLETSLPVYVRLSDGEDRYYLAKSLEHGQSLEIVDIAFRQLAEEETAETARRVWVDIAGASAETLSSFLRRLNNELEAVSRETALNPDAVCRRIRRITAVMQDYIATADVDAGDELGRQIKILFLGHLPRSGPEDRRLREEAAQEFLAALHHMVRLNFNLCTDPDSFELIDEMRGWWRPASPPQEFESAARRVARLGMQSLLLFAKQGVKNKPLREALVAAASQRVISNLAGEYVSRTPSLEEAVAYWLVNGEEQQEERSVRGVEAISEAKLDEYVGRLLIALEAPELQLVTIEQALEEVTDIMPTEGHLLESSVKRIGPVRQWARAVARARRIELSPERGEVVNYDPVEHSGDERLKIGREVRVQAPGVIKSGRGGIKKILIKAEVE